jgi:hypothetical protein
MIHQPRLDEGIGLLGIFAHAGDQVLAAAFRAVGISITAMRLRQPKLSADSAATLDLLHEEILAFRQAAVADIADASTKPGLSTPIKWPAEPTLGLKATYVPMRVAHLDNQDANFFAALRRNEASGAMELVSMRKGLFLRLSDFINEYDFADFNYPANDNWRDVHRMLRTDEGYADLAPPPKP